MQFGQISEEFTALVSESQNCMNNSVSDRLADLEDKLSKLTIDEITKVAEDYQMRTVAMQCSLEEQGSMLQKLTAVANLRPRPTEDVSGNVLSTSSLETELADLSPEERRAKLKAVRKEGAKVGTDL